MLPVLLIPIRIVKIRLFVVIICQLLVGLSHDFSNLHLSLHAIFLLLMIFLNFSLVCYYFYLTSYSFAFYSSMTLWNH